MGGSCVRVCRGWPAGGGVDRRDVIELVIAAHVVVMRMRVDDEQGPVCKLTDDGSDVASAIASIGNYRVA